MNEANGRDNVFDRSYVRLSVHSKLVNQIVGR